METTVVNLRKEAFDIYIGRKGQGYEGYLGNPHPIGYCKLCKNTHTRETCIAAFKKDFGYRLQSDAEFKRQVLACRGKKLGCFCKPQACHCDVIATYLNGLKNDYFIPVDEGF